MAGLLDHVFIDNMKNEFNEKTGCWPEGYMYADQNGVCTFKLKLEPD